MEKIKIRNELRYRPFLWWITGRGQHCNQLALVTAGGTVTNLRGTKRVKCVRVGLFLGNLWSRPCVKRQRTLPAIRKKRQGWHVWRAVPWRGVGKCNSWSLASLKDHAYSAKNLNRRFEFHYQHKMKAWMTQILFLDWLNRFDSFIGQATLAKALLLVDNCTT